MSEPLQFDYHPDADQICAFVEHALPAHEREQMLDHLAVCTECRAVVALSLPEVEEPVRAPVAARFKAWWLGWRMAWPAGVATAAIVLTVFYIHQTSIVRKTSAPAQIAETRSPAPPAPARQLQGPAANQAATPASNQSAVAKRLAPDAGLGVESPGKAETETKSEHESALGMQSRNSTVLDKPAQQFAAPQAALPGQIAGISAGSGSAVGARVASAPMGRAAAAHQRTPPAQTPERPVASANSTESARIAITGRAAQTVSVESSAPAIQSESVDMSNLALSEKEAQVTQFIQLKHPLPSGLPALSAAMQARRIVAIDARNGIFLSKDEGKHWKAIHPQWQGRAVRVERVGFPAANSTSFNLEREPERAALKAVGADPAPDVDPSLKATISPLAAAPGASLAGTVTDATGAVIPGTSVSITESATNAVRTVIADKAGHYLVDGLAPGTYTVEARARGFASLRMADVAVAANRQNVANLSLKIGAATQSVTVIADSLETVTDSVTVESSAKAKKRAAPAAPSTAPPVFAITTDNGERWTSADGVTWKRP
jgi:hypothetical protein